MTSKISSVRKWMKRPNKSPLASWIESAIIILPLVFIVRTWFYGLYQVPTGSMETTMLVGEGFFADKLSVWFKSPKHGDIITFNDPGYPYSKNKFKEIFQRYVWGPTNLTKRVIGVPGDHLKMTLEEGKPVVYRNGKKLDEPYLNKYPLIAVYEPEASRTQLLFKSYDPKATYKDQPFYRVNAHGVKYGGMKAKMYGEEDLKQPGEPYSEGGRILDVQEIKLGPDEYWAMGDNRRGSHDSRAWGPVKEKYIHGKILLRLWSIDSNQSWLLWDLLRHPIDFWKRVRWSRFLQPVH